MKLGAGFLKELTKLINPSHTYQKEKKKTQINKITSERGEITMNTKKYK